MNKISDIASLEKDFIDNIFELTSNISDKWPKLSKLEMAKQFVFFWEPSTRTKLSFEHAAKRLGFNVLDFSPESSSLKKGESFEDTILTLLAMKVDGFIIRHPEDHISKKLYLCFQKMFSTSTLEMAIMLIPHKQCWMYIR